jgi:general secretion pathway protein I
MIAGIKRQPPAGFTLVEVMVALAVVALAVPALLFTLYQQLEGTEYLRDRSMASWVAANRLNELKLVVAKQGAVPEGQLSGETRLAQRDWYWWIEQEGTEVPGFIRVDISVATEETAEKGLHTLTAFISAGSPQ